jgi:hypothetical protein
MEPTTPPVQAPALPDVLAAGKNGNGNGNGQTVRWVVGLLATALVA